MSRRAVLASIVLAGAPAAAEPTQLGAYFGPRLYSDDARLGYIDAAPAHPVLDNGVQLGARIARPLTTWLVPELELALAPTSTTAVGGADAVDVLWLEPRVHLRFELKPERRLQPFFLIGAGAPIVLSSARMTFDSGISGEGYVGGGLRFDTRAGFLVRFDARISLQPGVERFVAPEGDVTIGVELQLGKRRRAATERPPIDPALDRDQDGIADDADRCVDRAEDFDGFEDDDGCPDIDNDLDRVLDVADRCGDMPETYNGYQDDDGCPDTVPDEVADLPGTVEGLIYAEGETLVRKSAMPGLGKLAKLMAAHPSIKIVLVGHTDDREAKQFVRPADDEPAPDAASIAIDLALARAEALKQALAGLGVSAARIDVDGRGAEDPVADNDTPRGRLANRRVEIKLFVPAR